MTENIKTSIKNWAEDERPREKMANHGAETLSNSELLAIIINTGNKKQSALGLAKSILSLSNNNLDELGKLSIQDLQKVSGIGIAKAITIAAVLELGRRRSTENFLQQPQIKSSKHIAEYLKTILTDNNVELFAVLFLNNAKKIKSFKIISKGGMTGTVADPRVIFKLALEYGAACIILAHNHPSGILKPSEADIRITKKMVNAGLLLDVTVVDHIIVSNEGYFSFADNDMI